jgi:HEAT repeat protein
MIRGDRQSAIRLALGVAAVSFAALAGGCNTGSAGAKAKSTSVFQAFEPTTPQQAAAWAVDPYDADNRQRGILLLANAPFGGEPVYVDLYEAALDDGDTGVRTAAVKALGLHGRPEHAVMIAPMLEEEDRLLRWESTSALQRLHNPEVINALTERLDLDTEEEPEVRAAAATALGQYAQVRVIDTLIGSLGDPNLHVNRATQGSLRTLTGQELGDDVGAWVEWMRSVDDPFAEGLPYEYPVFNRDKRFVEWIMPWLQPPNEVAAAPVGYDPPRN